MARVPSSERSIRQVAITHGLFHRPRSFIACAIIRSNAAGWQCRAFQLLLAQLLRDQARYGREKIQVKGAIATCYCTRYLFRIHRRRCVSACRLREETLKILASEARDVARASLRIVKAARFTLVCMQDGRESKEPRQSAYELQSGG